mgnify:CR=1 FL=1
MSRERMVTRSINVGIYSVMTVNMDTLQVESVQVEIPSWNTMSDKKLTEAVQTALAYPHKYVQHEAVGTKEVLYGMPEADFIKLAKVLPPRTKQDDAED